MSLETRKLPLGLIDYFGGLQGGLLLVSAVYFGIFPEKAAQPPSPFKGATPTIIHTMALTCLGLGLVQVQAAYQRNRGPLLLSVPGRALAVYFFWTDGLATRHMAVFEGAMGMLTALGLLHARRAEEENVKKTT